MYIFLLGFVFLAAVAGVCFYFFRIAESATSNLMSGFPDTPQLDKVINFKKFSSNVMPLIKTKDEKTMYEHCVAVLYKSIKELENESTENTLESIEKAEINSFLQINTVRGHFFPKQDLLEVIMFTCDLKDYFSDKKIELAPVEKKQPLPQMPYSTHDNWKDSKQSTVETGEFNKIAPPARKYNSKNITSKPIIDQYRNIIKHAQVETIDEQTYNASLFRAVKTAKDGNCLFHAVASMIDTNYTRSNDKYKTSVCSELRNSLKENLRSLIDNIEGDEKSFFIYEDILSDLATEKSAVQYSAAFLLGKLLNIEIVILNGKVEPISSSIGNNSPKVLFVLFDVGHFSSMKYDDEIAIFKKSNAKKHKKKHK